MSISKKTIARFERFAEKLSESLGEICDATNEFNSWQEEAFGEVEEAVNTLNDAIREFNRRREDQIQDMAQRFSNHNSILEEASALMQSTYDKLCDQHNEDDEDYPGEWIESFNAEFEELDIDDFVTDSPLDEVEIEEPDLMDEDFSNPDWDGSTLSEMDFDGH